MTENVFINFFTCIFLICFSGVVNKDLNVWLDRARPANTFNPPTLMENIPTQVHGVHTRKNMFASKKNNKCKSLTYSLVYNSDLI